MSSTIRKLGSTRAGVWVIKHFERLNPWTLNIRANRIVQAQIGAQ